jgi:predicted metalloprotease with PDZ domain
VEGVAEHYSREILRRSGAVSQEVFDETLDRLRRRGARVRRFVGESTGNETALAVAFFHDLDQRIRTATNDEKSLDDVVATFVDEVATIDRAGLIQRIREVTGYDAEELVAARIPPSKVETDES